MYLFNANHGSVFCGFDICTGLPPKNSGFVTDVNSFFPCTARLWNSQPTECIPSTYDLDSFKSQVYRQLLYLGTF